jgi:lipoprotein-anchoring transpeptidase ErfK/SrfK
VQPSGALKVSATSGKLTKVQVTDANGTAVPGAIAADGLSWAPAGGLAVGTKYQVVAQAADAKGVATSSTSSFSTLTPSQTDRPRDNIDDGETYGVGMIVRVDFPHAVQDKAAVVQGLTVEASDGTQVKGHWFGDDRIDFRPENFWKPGTKVTVHYRLKSVEVSPGVYGGKDQDENFVIGRSSVTTADADSDEMTIQRDGQAPQTVPFTAGKPGFDSWSGTMVVMDKEATTRMVSTGIVKAGSGEEYDIGDVPHAMRLTDSGTFVHGNYWGHAFGKSNSSHGCLGLEDEKGGSADSAAGKFYSSSLVGDVVKVVNSKGGQVSASNGLGGWNTDWSAW